VLLNLTGTPTQRPAVPLSPDPAPLRKYDVVAEYPHDPQALTQGLIYTGGFLYESIGLQGQSSIRKVELKTGRVIQQHAVDSRFLGEGLTEWRGQLIQLTPMRTRPKRDSLVDLGQPEGPSVLRLGVFWTVIAVSDMTSIRSNQSLPSDTTVRMGTHA